MADRAISELIAANQVTPTDLFVLEQSGTAKKLTGQILENWLVALADGHGGIQSIAKASTSGLVDTYRITLADTTTFDFKVTNGKSINSIAKASTSGLVDTYRITYNDSTTTTFTVTNGAKGDKGDNQYVWIKYASQQPTASSHSFGDVPDNWIGVYSGASSTAPTDWTQYNWCQIKGEKGNTGDPARLTSSAVEYQVSDSGVIVPSGTWSTSVPVVAQGRYLWTRTTNKFNTGSSVVSYSVSRMGLDGSGSVSSVAGISPNSNGNVPLTATDVGALPSTGGDLTGELRMNGQKLSGLNDPTADDEAANLKCVKIAYRRGTAKGDLNDVIIPGWYWIQVQNATNTPVGDNVAGKYGHLEVLSSGYPDSGANVLQRYTEYPTGKMWVRTSTNGWNDWKRVDSLSTYPVGSIYMSANSTSPASIFGGTWEQLKDRFLLGAGSTYTAGNTGGSATHTLTASEMPKHSHTTTISAANSGGYGLTQATAYADRVALVDGGATNTGTSGSGSAHNNMPPYLVVYMWKRTA